MRTVDLLKQMPVATLAIGCIFVASTQLSGQKPGQEPVPGQKPTWLPKKEVRWRVPVADSPLDQRRIQNLLNDADRQQLPMLPKFRALAVADIVLMRTPSRMFAVDFVTGKRIWAYPWMTTHESDDGVEQADVRVEQLQQRIWENTPYGQFSTDGDSVFFLDDVRFISMDPVKLSFAVPQEGAEDSDSNLLLALDIAREGALLWRAGGKPEANQSGDPRLAGAFFLAAPVAVDGSLYVLAELENKVQLLVLDAKTGGLDWSIELHDLVAGRRASNKLRHLAGATVVVDGDTVVCQTMSNRVIGVDIGKRKVRWTYEYDEDPKLLRGFGHGMIRLLQDARSRWLESQMVRCGDRVLFTAYESPRLHCLNLSSGERMWEYVRRDAMFFDYLDDDSILVVGPIRVEAVKVSDGTSKWEAPVTLDARPSGRGFQRNGFYYLPTHGSKVLCINLESGEVESQAECQSVLGNLIPYKQNVISHGPLWLSALNLTGNGSSD